jgi:seryl-tRNA synthetase
VDLIREVKIIVNFYLPRAQIYHLEDELSLIATAEITCAGIMTSEIIAKKELPKKYVALSHCFRKEAGQGINARGLYRLHQFTKVEMFGYTEGDFEASNNLHQEMLGIQEELYTTLGLPIRILDMPTEELGGSAYRKYDIETYFPSKGWGEISSTSNCTDYQSIRLNCMYFDKNMEKKLMHTVNGTAVAVPRLIMAILENFYVNNKVYIPEALHPYTLGLKIIE